jgi:ketoreductase RED2
VRSLDGKVAIVTGSSSGIGAAIARYLADEGAKVVVNSSTSVEPGEKLAAELPDAIYVQADVSDEEQAKRLIASTVDRYGKLDILVNNAGFTKRIPHEDLDALTDEVWRRILDVNIMGTWYVTHAAVPHLEASGDGAVVNVTSVAGLRPGGSSIPYAVSKAGLNHLTRLLAKVLGPRHVRVIAIAPGLIETPWTDGWDDAFKAVAARAPLRRTGQPEDIAEATILALKSAYLTGEVIAVDGGTQLG